jgi:hypothetical protein
MKKVRIWICGMSVANCSISKIDRCRSVFDLDGAQAQLFD